MTNSSVIQGFSKLSRNEKIELLAKQFPALNIKSHFNVFDNQNDDVRMVINDISENVLCAYQLPYSISPNFLINKNIYHIPMVIEESSVVAAASWAAKFWYNRGGFNYKITGTKKKGQVHFICENGIEKILGHWNDIRNKLNDDVKPYTANMQKRGGGITKIDLIDKSIEIAGYFQIDVSFETADAMGANFINTCLEVISASFKEYVFSNYNINVETIMSILSNYVPNCMVECKVECKHEQLDKIDGEMPYKQFIKKFETAINIAQIDINRAVTHNKGIMNGVDAVLLATGNDFRAVEAGVHAYASKDGGYKALSVIATENGMFSYSIRLPLAIGTFGGVTSMHPLAKLSIEILGKPSSKQLMGIVASAGMANNFSAVKSLVTKGIQKGHMKLHLKNVLSSLNATEKECALTEQYFRDRVVSYKEIEAYIKSLR